MNIKAIYQRMNQFEKVWLLVFSTIILATTVYFSYGSTKWDSPWSVILNWVISPVSALTGVVCVVLCAKGHIDNWIWGLVNSVTYGAVAWASGYYGDWMLNWFFFIPTQIIIYFAWRKNTSSFGIVNIKKIKPIYIVAFFVSAALMIFILTKILLGVDSWFINAWKRNATVYTNLAAMFGLKNLGPFLDATTVVLQIFAEIFLITRLAQQWPLWFATNVASIIIWLAVIITDKTSYGYAIPTLVMWIAYLVNSLYGNIVWFKKPITSSNIGGGIPKGKIVSLSGYSHTGN